MAFHYSDSEFTIVPSQMPPHALEAEDAAIEANHYDEIAARLGFDPDRDLAATRQERKKPRKPAAQEVANLTDAGSSLNEQFEVTYVPARHEAVWLRDSLRPFAERALLKDVLALVKGGKEANVYLCEAHAAMGNALMAAKVYRPRQFRNLRNDKMYREGRELLNSAGGTLHARNTREMRAIHNKTSFGESLTHISWLMHEYATLTRLHAAGAATPRPIAAGENAILMEFVGDRRRAAPTLHSVGLGSGEAHRLHREVLRNISLMLSMGMIHGDLSAYNILYWEGKVTLIDFPQVTFAEANSSAYAILQRDVARVADYFAAQGVESDPVAETESLWDRYVPLPRPVGL